MKTVRSILALLLSLAMLASFGVCFAAQKDDCGYEYYVSLGDSIAINEAVELAKTYSGDKAGTFVNGVLGGISRGKADA